MMSKQLLLCSSLIIALLFGCGPPPGPPLPRPGDAPAQNNTTSNPPPESESATATTTNPESGFRLTSPVMQNGGQLPVTFTCDGEHISPPLAWQGAPEETVGYALAMHHIPDPDDTHWYWVVYNIPAETNVLEADATTVGTFGTNSVNNELAYTPPCSQGPGEKRYTITVYALSAAPDLPNPNQVDHDTLLAAIADITLARASLDVTYERGQTEESQKQGQSENQNQPDCAGASAFQSYNVRVSCDETYLYVETDTAQPDHDIMRGITAWILRVPLPFAYVGNSAWKIPLEPTWLTSHAATHARGPIAMAVNGVPVYHFDKRPDAPLGDNYVYEARHDTVQQGELDHCGGHAGQGEDYHYHTAPVCLLDKHDLAAPIGYTLGGAKIFYGTGADDYYGEGKYNHINNLPAGELDECNGYQMPDGSYVYYTTHEPPYTIGCHHEAVDWALQIEPHQMRDLGQFGRNATEILSLTIDDEVRTLLFKTDRGELNAIVYQPSTAGENCWDFQFRTDVETAVTAETHCRVD